MATYRVYKQLPPILKSKYSMDHVANLKILDATVEAKDGLEALAKAKMLPEFKDDWPVVERIKSRREQEAEDYEIMETLIH